MNCRIYSEFRPKDGPRNEKDGMSEIKNKISIIEESVSALDSRFLHVAELIKAQQEYIDTRAPTSTSLESVFTEFYRRIGSLENTLTSLNNRVSSLEERSPPEEKNMIEMLKGYMQDIQNREKQFQQEISNKIKGLRALNEPKDSNRDDSKLKELNRRASLRRTKSIPKKPRKMSAKPRTVKRKFK